MNEDHDKHLERQVDQLLRQLKPCRAPATLRPRVMAAIRLQAHRPWWQRPLETWPRWKQFLAVVLALGIASVLAWIVGQGVQYLDLASVRQASNGFLDRFEFIWTAVSSLGNACLIVLRQIHPFLLCVGGLVCIATYVSCLGMGTILFRLATNKSQP